jgi:arabinofuranosyltransferase
VSENTRIERDDWPWLTSLFLVGSLALAIFALNARAGVPLDDAWIHFQFARNLARGDGLSFNPGQPTSGSTAPLWTLLLATVYLAGGRFPLVGQALSAICYLALLMATYALGKRLTGRRWTAWLAGTVVAVNGRMVWAALSALEICLFAALSLWAIAAHLSDRGRGRYRLRTAALFGLAALTRPEGYLLFALAVADRIWGYLSQHETRNTRHVFRIACSVSLFAAIVAPYLIFSLLTSGHLLPNTYHAKATVSLLPDREFRDFLGVSAVYLILDNPLLLPFFLFGLILLVRRAPLLSLWCMGLPSAYGLMRASLYQHGRYLMPLIPCNALVGVWGLLAAKKLAQRRWPILASKIHTAPGKLGGLCVPAVLSALLIIAGTAWRLPTMARQYAQNVADIDQMHVRLGHWVKENTAPDAVVALNDIGAIAYVSQRKVVDLAGLVTPEITPALRAPGQTQQLVDFLARRDVDYVIIFPNWFPGLAARDDVLKEVHRVILEERSISGGETMVVYQAHW